MTETNAPRVVFVALDAMESVVFEHLLETGALPNISLFLKDSSKAEVTSEGDTLHGSLWPTFASGTGPASPVSPPGST